MTLHVIGIVANFKSILVVQVRCAKAFVAFICCALRRGFHRAEDFRHAEDFVVTQRIFRSRGFCSHHAEDFVAQRILSRRGFCRAEDFVTQRIFHAKVLSQRILCTEDFVAQRRGFCA
jgi:hypothetical protein